jgi:NADH:ubiquinone oxidoreductase subunit F (NADH-binding)
MTLAADVTVLTKISSTPRVGTSSRLLSGGEERESIERYLAASGYAEVAPESFLETVEASGLRGRGGAAFPTAVKIRTVREGRDVPVVVANGEEGEPASVKDRWLLRNRPHLVLDGLRLASQLVGADKAIVYVSDGPSATSIESALAELAETGIWDAEVEVRQVSPSYVAGEETAVVQALNGGPALPTEKPPRPFEEGVHGRPTLVNNVETLANLPIIQRLGAAGYRDAGTPGSPGTFLLTLTGCESAGLYEVAFGETMRDVLSSLGEDLGQVSGLLMGGYFSGLLGLQALDVSLDYDSFKAAGSGLGCGAVAVVSTANCPVAVAAAVMEYFARENAGQCGSCFNGTAAMSAVLDGLLDGRAQRDDIERLRRWSTFLRGRGACGTLDGATNIAASLLREFPELVGTHLAGQCPSCGAGSRMTDPPFAVSL